MKNIREIIPSDNLALSKIIKGVFEEYDAPRYGTVYSDPTTDNLYELFQENRSILWVAVYNKRIVGCCGIYPTPGLPLNCAELVKFYLAEKARGKGIGKALMERSVQSAKEFGYTDIYIESLPEFSNAIRIYEKQGFTNIDKPLGESGHNACNIWMIKKL